MTHGASAHHWDEAYAEGDQECSWTESQPADSLAAIAMAAPELATPIIDVGGGASPLAGRLLDVGHLDVTVLDVSAAALDLARRRLGPRAHRVTWVVADLLAWTPPRRYGIWHDRAVLHFFTDEADRARYAATLRDALEPHGWAVIATFAPAGPESCSGLPVRRSSAMELAELLGPRFVVRHAAVREHRTPSGAAQPFTWVVAERIA